jgi:beta propeller repeat protein
MKADSRERAVLGRRWTWRRAAWLLLLGAALPLAGLPLAGQAQDGYSTDEFGIVRRDRNQLRPRISGKYVVWQDYRNHEGRSYDPAAANADVYGYDLDRGSDFRVTTNGTAARPAVSGAKVVFADSRVEATGLDIRLYDIERDELESVTDQPNAQDYPAIDGNLVVWQDRRHGSDWDVYGKDLSTDDSFTVIRRDGDQVKPAISGKIVVWEDRRRANEPDIYYRHLDRDDIIRVTDNGESVDPAVSGDYIVYKSGSGGEQRIRVYQISTRENRSISDRLQIEGGPRIDGNLVVWADRRNDEDYNVWAYDLSAAQEFRVTRADRDQTAPDISGQTAVWETAAGENNRDIRGGRLTVPAAQATPTATSAQATPTPGQARPPSGGPCEFTLGFKLLRDLIPGIVGACLENEWHNAENGDGLQQTTGGLLVWRKADNWTAFTNGSITWLNGPCGLQTRPNTGPFYNWEGRVGATCQ